MKFRIKNCPYCAYWNSPQRLSPRKFCALHQDKEDQPSAIIKTIKEEKRELWGDRIVFGGFAFCCLSIGLLAFISTIVANLWIGSFILVVFVGAGLLIIKTLIDLDKMTRQSIKALQKKQSEWIIEYE